MRDERVGVERKKRSWSSRILEFAFWIAVALVTAWVLIENVNTILPANNF